MCRSFSTIHAIINLHILKFWWLQVLYLSFSVLFVCNVRQLWILYLYVAVLYAISKYNSMCMTSIK